MKFSAMVCACVLVLAAGVASGATATNVYKLDPNDPYAEQACANRGGTVGTDAQGIKRCTLPAGCSATVRTLVTTTVLDPNDANASKACTDACGTLSTNETGQQFCTKPVSPLGAAAPSREPTNIR